MNNALPVSLWLSLTGFAWLPGANFFLSTIITFLLIIFGFAFVWGILGGSMPRSGGSYVYNSRILHPALGLSVSFCNAGVVMLAWVCVLAPWFGEVGLPMLLDSLGFDTDVVDYFRSGWGLYLLTTIVNLSSFFMVLTGMKNFFRVQRVFVIWSLLGVVIAGITIAVTSHTGFVSIWNSYADQFQSLSFNETITQVSNEMGGIPETWNWRSTLGLMLPISWGGIYGYVITFIAGEVKLPRKTIFRAQVLNTVISAAIFLWFGLEYQRMLGWEGIHMVAWIAEEGFHGYRFPFELSYINIASMITGFNQVLGVIMAGAFLAANWLWIVFSYIAWSRAAFAWGLDRLGPRGFTRVSKHFNQPILLLSILFIASQVILIRYTHVPLKVSSIAVEVLQLLTVFLVTIISCIIFPYRSKVRPIWNASPYRHWKIGKVPVTTISGSLGLVLVGLLIVSYYINDAFSELHFSWTIIYLAVMVLGFLWYYFWKRLQADRGHDVTRAFHEIPPE
ncbi:MAG: amino acid permease [Spirochaetales bacterium]|nr:amino acid permease [Spirochaetales bacterium]MCF7939287.1 amino acid permease [Spirochaetales bacterium]